MGSTMDNLQAAFAGESQANRRYLFFAEKAEKEGYPQVARLFRAVAEAETVHARNHFDTMGGIGTTAENLRTAIDGEGFEFRRMYPEFVEQAGKDANRRAKSTFEWAGAVEKIHHGLYEEALKAVSGGQKLPDKPYFVCQVCGYTVAGEAPDKCPVCGALKIKFKQIL
jgi:rubrerythrin